MTKEEFLSLKKGDKIFCIKDFYMTDGSIEYSSGKYYDISSNLNFSKNGLNIKDNSGRINHSMSINLTMEYFELTDNYEDDSQFEDDFENEGFLFKKKRRPEEFQIPPPPPRPAPQRPRPMPPPPPPPPLPQPQEEEREEIGYNMPGHSFHVGERVATNKNSQHNIKVGTIIGMRAKGAVVEFDEDIEHTSKYNDEYGGKEGHTAYIPFRCLNTLELHPDDDSQFEEGFEENMKTKFKDHLNEKLGFPNAVKPYSELIYQICSNKLKKYLSRKGYRANYSEVINIEWNEIKPIVIDFKKYPVDDVELRFNIKVYKGKTGVDCNSGFSSYGKRGDDDSSYWKISKHNKDVRRSIKLSMDIVILIGKDDSIDIDFIQNFLKDNISHELLHSYEAIYNPNFDKEIWSEVFSYSVDNEDVRDSQELYNFFWKIYKINKSEMNATVAEAEDVKSLEELKQRSVWELIQHLKEFNPEKSVDNVLNELKLKDKERNKFYVDFGKLFYRFYRGAAITTKTTMDPKIKKLRDKDMLTIFKFWKNRFNNASEYLFKKVSKKIGN